MVIKGGMRGRRGNERKRKERKGMGFNTKRKEI